MTIPISTDEVAVEDLLHSFPDGLNAVVVGAGGGIGAAVTDQLSRCSRVGRVLALSRVPSVSWANVVTEAIDIEDEASIKRTADIAKDGMGDVHLVFVATGILHEGVMQPEKRYAALAPETLQRAFAVNASGPALIAKHFLPLLPRDGKSCFAAVSARVGSITDNGLGGWYAYRASKAALNQLIKTLSIEISRTHWEAVCLALHPGTTDTRLSKPFQGAVPEGKLFTPAYSANRMLQVIDAASAAETGSLVAWDGEVLPY